VSEFKELQPGVHLARVVVGGNVDTAQVKVINLNEARVRLDKVQLLGSFLPLEVERPEMCDRRHAPVDHKSPVVTLLKDLQEGVTPDILAKAEELLNKY